ncbi:MAG: IS66 family insertion sequence element accessory protein TnpA [Clostridium sp.]
MTRKLSNKEWEGYIKQYYSNEISITINEFCRENNLSKQQFHYHKKKISETKTQTSTVFQALKIVSDEEPSNKILAGSEIKITLANATISIPVSETTLIESIIKELATSC